ncbi:Protein ABSCISIC ACID-INSENSITIVE 5 [Linum perenne]
MNSQADVDSPPLQLHHHSNRTNHPVGRQSSIYSLTLDEFQHTLHEGGKNFGSMNMDEFLNSIWTAEENNHHHHTSTPATPVMKNAGAGISKQPSLPRQGSITLPEKLCRKTVDEVWSEIHNGKRSGQRKSGNNGGTSSSGANVQNAGSVPRQQTFGEMTLEDFLVKAGVVREQDGGGGSAAVPPPQQQQQYNSTYQNHVAYQSILPQPYGYAVVRPASPVSSDNVDGAVGNNQYGMDMTGGFRGRKRVIDGPVERVVERRQRRMIKNRESAARSRARKQAYTVELEAELNQLKEENIQLKQTLVELERKRKQQNVEEARTRVQSKAQKASENLRVMRRNLSCPL